MLGSMQQERIILLKERADLESSRLREREEVREFHEAAQRFLTEKEKDNAEGINAEAAAAAA